MIRSNLQTREPSRPIRYVTHLEKVAGLSQTEKQQLAKVSHRYAFRANDYYLSLIDWDDPNDPIRQIIVPRLDETLDGGQLDASNEAANTVAHGIQHKYPDTALLLCNDVCGGYCRYCFRKRLFINGNDEATHDLSEGLAYIAAHPEISNVLLTGGDPLLMSTRRIRELLSGLRAIPHVQIIRIGSKMPAFNPWRILDDPELLATLEEHSTAKQRIYLMAHFDHPRELTDPAAEAIDRVIRAGVICANQCPMLRGVNDDPETLSMLFRQLSWIGCPPYYLFQGRPTAGNAPYAVPIVEGWEIFRSALRMDSGLARRARFVMSYETGKIEVMAVDQRHIYLRYLRAKYASLRGQFFICRRDDEATWFDQLQPVQDQGNSAEAAANLVEPEMFS